MIRLLSACVSLCAFLIIPAKANQRRQPVCVETGTVMAPVCKGRSSNFLAGVRSISVTLKRERPRKEISHKANRRAHNSGGGLEGNQHFRHPFA